MKLIIKIFFLFAGLSTSTAFGQQDGLTGDIDLFNPAGVHPILSKADTSFGFFTEVSPADSIFVTPADEDFWVLSTASADYDSDGDLDIAVLG